MELPKVISFQKKIVETLHEWFCAAIEKAFSTKFVIEIKLQNVYRNS